MPTSTLEKFSLCLLIVPPQPSSTLFPYTTLFRSLAHLVRVDVVGHVHVVEQHAAREAALGRAADLALLGGDAVQRHVVRLDPDLRERPHHPVVEIAVGLDRKSTRLNSSHVACS